MSLLDGLLLEPYRPVVEGGKSISSITHPTPNPSTPGNGLIATASTSSAHGYKNGESVQISGVTGDGTQWWNGVFVVFGINEADPNATVFKYRMVGVPPETTAGGTSKKSAKLPQMEIYIADLGPNAPFGSGIITDPFNGTAHEPSGRYAAMTISALTSSGRIATATCAGHDFEVGERVTIVGVKAEWDYNDQPKLKNCWYMGTYQVKETGSGWFKYVMLSEAYGNAEPEAAGGVIQCWRERERFDIACRGISGRSLINISPGLFQTKGAIEPLFAGGWCMQRKQRIAGSGLGITVIKLVSATAVPKPGQITAIVYNDHPEITGGVEVIDLTVDCNADGQASIYSNCGAVVARGGNGVVFRRLGCKNFASRGPSGFESYNENFPIAAAGPNQVNTVIDQCMGEFPSINAVHNSLTLNSGGVSSGSAKGCVVRNCYVDLRYSFSPWECWVESVAVDAQDPYLITIETLRPHGLKIPGNVAVSGFKAAGESPAINGVYKIESLTENTVTFRIFFNASTHAPIQMPFSMVGAPVDSHVLKIDPWLHNQQEMKLKAVCGRPHNLTVNNRVLIGSITINGLIPKMEANTCNGNFQVTEVLSLTEFIFQLNQKPDVPDVPEWEIGHYGVASSCRAGHAAIHNDMATGAVTEGNRVMHGGGVAWQDTGSSLDLVARNNFAYDTHLVRKSMGGRFPSQAAESLTHEESEGRYEAVFEADTSDLGLDVGHVVFIEGAKVGGSIANPYNGYHIVKSISGAVFRYKLTGNPGGNADAGTGAFAPVWQNALFIMESNITDLRGSFAEGIWGEPRAISMGAPAAIPYTYRQVAARENIVRQYDLGTSSQLHGIRVLETEKYICEGNVIEVGGDPNNYEALEASFMNNRNPAGKLLGGNGIRIITMRMNLRTLFKTL